MERDLERCAHGRHHDNPCGECDEGRYAREQGEGSGWLGIGLAGFCFAGAVLLGLPGTLRRAGRGAVLWFRLKRVCSWCQPPRRIGGNPFARETTHSVCPSCLKREKAKLSSERDPVPTSSGFKPVACAAGAGAGKPFREH